MPEKKEFIDYYIEHTDRRFEEIHKKLDQLIGFRWMLVGAAVAVSGLVSIGLEIAKAFAGGK